ncbi:MAG: AAA domain-containing protein [Chloroflexaceae bacterium]|nr:AAA domain-containing protein [Chloroflexaceae bacterium]
MLPPAEATPDSEAIPEPPPYLPQRRKTTDTHRRQLLPEIQDMTGAFVRGKTALGDFHQQLAAYLASTNDWGTRNLFVATLDILANQYDQEAEAVLRSTLDGLNATNVGTRIEDFSRFLEREKIARRHTHPLSQVVVPGRSALLISLFASWLDPEENVVVARPSLRDGLGVLHAVGALPAPANLRFTRGTVVVTTAEDYAAVCQTIHAIGERSPPLQTSSPYWYEAFLNWVHDRRDDIYELLRDDGSGDDRNDTSAPPSPSALTPRLIPDAPLPAVPAPRLHEGIRAIRRHLLIAESLIRRIYHALVLGQHVILSGPPGIGKTELARLLPQTLWDSSEAGYTVRIATATDEWTPRHVIGGIVPVTEGGQVRYEIAYGCLARTVMENWDMDKDRPETWTPPQRRTVIVRRDPTEEEYRGRWLVIDEFNRAPIDLALGEALTAIGNEAGGLQVPVAQGTAALPIPRDFRIIGTLNTFDRHFLNQMSEALKRRFAFIDMQPPPRQERPAEQAIVLRKSLEHLGTISQGAITITPDGCRWSTLVEVSAETAEIPGDRFPWRSQWKGPPTPVRQGFEEGWRLFEVMRLYRPFGTAQAIRWTVAYFGAGLLDGLSLEDEVGWRRALGMAFADTLADQLQILFPDELESLLIYLRTTSSADFASAYQSMLARLTNPRRRSAQVIALQSIKDRHEQPYLSMDEARRIIEDDQHPIDEAVLAPLFHADQPRGRLECLEERLERFFFERTM